MENISAKLRKESYLRLKGCFYPTGVSISSLLKHIEQIKEALKIRGIHSTSGSWISKKEADNVQIDLLIDRDDRVINLCEMKFYNEPFQIDKKMAENIQKKVSVFSSETKTNKNIFITFISTYGLKSNMYSTQYIQNELTLTDLFIAL